MISLFNTAHISSGAGWKPDNPQPFLCFSGVSLYFVDLFSYIRINTLTGEVRLFLGESSLVEHGINTARVRGSIPSWARHAKERRHGVCRTLWLKASEA